MSVKSALNKLKTKHIESVVDLEKELGDLPCFSTGHVLIDSVLGGGFPKGKIVELFGLEGSGKSSMALQTAVQVQKQGLGVLYVDFESGFNVDYALSLGVNKDMMLVTQPSCAEEGFELMRDAIDQGEIGLIIVDSIAAIVPKKQIDGEMGMLAMGQQSLLISTMLKQLTAKLTKKNVSLIGINQIRSVINSYGGGQTTPGGFAFKFYSFIRVKITKIAGLKMVDTGQVLSKYSGQRVRVGTVKNKGCCPFRECEVDFIYGKGYDEVGSVLEYLVSKGLVSKSGSYFDYKGTKVQGLDPMKEFLAKSPDYAELRKLCGNGS